MVRRSQRYKKRRFIKYRKKLQIQVIEHHYAQLKELSAVLWSQIVTDMVRIELQTLQILEKLNVPSEQYKYYLGAAKAAASETLQFTSETLEKLFEELEAIYEARGLDPEVLKIVIPASITFWDFRYGYTKMDFAYFNVDFTNLFKEFPQIFNLSDFDIWNINLVDWLKDIYQNLGLTTKWCICDYSYCDDCYLKE
ncbi:MAG: hypothetical protein LM587_02660 [Candidatus Aenigmarchaeota archaeon]|nr:hypothetical protein [Candidatus Aenigmarchaeota archaeon]